MQQFTVPQFIDVEDKIIGPITTRQFLIILTGAILTGVSYKIFDFMMFITVGLFILAITAVFAFVKINGRPFHFFILNVLQTLKRPKIRIWYQSLNGLLSVYETEKEKTTKPAPLTLEKVYSESRLSELSLIVDTRGAYKGENNNNQFNMAKIDKDLM